MNTKLADLFAAHGLGIFGASESRSQGHVKSENAGQRQTNANSVAAVVPVISQEQQQPQFKPILQSQTVSTLPSVQQTLITNEVKS